MKKKKKLTFITRHSRTVDFALTAGRVSEGVA